VRNGVRDGVRSKVVLVHLWEAVRAPDWARVGDAYWSTYRLAVARVVRGELGRSPRALGYRLLGEAGGAEIEVFGPPGRPLRKVRRRLSALLGHPPVTSCYQGERKVVPPPPSIPTSFRISYPDNLHVSA
jgi:hypothetical protein